MIKPKTPKSEKKRLKTLKSLGILDTPHNERFDCITRIVSRIFKAPITLITLIDENRQWFKSSIGLELSETHRDISFCAHAILGENVFIIPDTLKDERFFDNPLVVGFPFTRFYAGCPLKLNDGSTIGTLCIIDNTPRAFKEADITLLKDLASMVKREFIAIQVENSAAQFRSTMDSTFDAIIVLDNQGGILEFNAAAEATFGYEHNEAIGKDLLDLILPRHYHKAYRSDFKTAIKTGKISLIDQHVEIEAIHQDGHKFPIEIAIAKENKLTNELSGAAFVGFIRDITDRKLAAAQIIQASKIATLGEMATSVAHELNQPLCIISMAVANSRRQISKGKTDLDYFNHKLKRIDSQISRATAIIDHMRMFGREAKETPEPIDPRNVVTNALNLMGEQLRLADIEVITEFSQNCPSFLGHIIQMEQVMLNLLTNARDAMVVRDGAAKITLRVFKNDEGVNISSQDTGGGIPDEVLPRIFEPFYTTKVMGKGTGLGLSLSYGIVRDMDGTIVAENIGEGARFTITLPIIASP